MSAGQIDQLVKMANQIARNLAAWGDEAEVAAKTGEHIEKFWTWAMRQQLMDFWHAGGEGLSPVMCRVLASSDQTNVTGEQ